MARTGMHVVPSAPLGGRWTGAWFRGHAVEAQSHGHALEAQSRGHGVGTFGDPGTRFGDLAADWALTQLGKPYVWAAAGPAGYDCSGLTMRAWQRAGIALPHWTGTQWLSGPQVPLDAMKRGDLLFFGGNGVDLRSINHVGIYIGAGQMVHAPKTGDVVRVASIWRPDMVGVVRPQTAPGAPPRGGDGAYAAGGDEAKG